jgi:hypothetical protein
MNLRHISMTARIRLVRALRAIWFLRLYDKYHELTMAPRGYFLRNMLIVDERRHVKGCVVECGVWRGGMSGGMPEVLGPDREYFLFDSFEGLPPATDPDGEDAKTWQKDTQGATYHDNCRAPIDFAERSM